MGLATLSAPLFVLQIEFLKCLIKEFLSWKFEVVYLVEINNIEFRVFIRQRL